MDEPVTDVATHVSCINGGCPETEAFMHVAVAVAVADPETGLRPAGGVR